jgi:UDP-3-O-[3-hydroxymyristoyl] glucosamine N-acyltransferase
MRLAELARAIGARLVGDGDVDVQGVAAVDVAGPDQLGFVAHAHERTAAFQTRAAALLVDVDFAADQADRLPCPVLAAREPGRALGQSLALLHPRPAHAAGIHPRAVVDAGAVVDASAVVGPGVVVEGGVVVGPGCVLHANAVLRRGVRLGARVTVGPGSVLGDDGFVTVAVGDENQTVPHAGGVVVGDDVEIGANVCVDRGLLSDTRVGARCRIDNLVQIAHDVVLGCNVVVVAQTGIAGFARVGDGAVLAGQAGVNPHVRIAPRVRVGGQAGVTHDIVDEGAAVAGTPAVAHLVWLKSMARLHQLDELARRVRTLERGASPARSTTITTSATTNSGEPSPTPEKR